MLPCLTQFCEENNGHRQRNVIHRKQVELPALFIFLIIGIFNGRNSSSSYRLVIHISIDFKKVGVARFELAAPCSQNRCANRTALYPDNRTGIIQSYPIHRNWCFL